MRRPLTLALFLALLILIDGVFNEYRVTDIIVGSLTRSVRDFFWFVGRLVGLVR